MARTISIKMTPEDAANLAAIMQSSRIEKGASEALRICVEDAFHFRPDFSKDLEDIQKIDNSKVDFDESLLAPKSFVIDEKLFEDVYLELKKQLSLNRPRVTFVVKACLASARVRLERECMKRVDTTITDSFSNLPSSGEMMMAVGRLFEAKDIEKITRIHEIIKGV